MIFEIVYTPRIQDPVIVAEFSTRIEAIEYMEILKDSRPQTYKFCQIVEKG